MQTNNRIYRIIAAALGVVVLIIGIWFFSTIVFYILGAAVLAIMGKPIVHGIEKIQIKSWSAQRWLSALVALITLMVIVVGLIALIMPIVIDQLHFLSNYNVNDLTEVLRQPVANVENMLNVHFPNAGISVKQILEEELTPLFNSKMLSNTVGTIAGATIDIMMALFCVTFITYFFLKDEKMFNNLITSFFPAKYDDNVNRAIDRIINLLIRYFIGISIESLIKLVLITLPLYFIGLDFNTALIIGVISAVLNVIPYVGPLMGALMGFVIAIINPVTDVTVVSMLVQMAVVFGVFQLLDNIVLQPYIYASSVKAHPLEIFIVILMAGYIAGVTGMLFAIPTYTVLRVFAKEFFSNFRIVQKITDSMN